MTIDRHNYEVFLIDYLDGKLDPSLVGELLLFFEQNPDIKTDFEGLEDTVLVSETIPFPHKSNLKKKSFFKNGIENELDYLYIASVEGVLTSDERKRLDAEVKRSKARSAEFEFYKKTILQPSPEITFPNKGRLKRAAIIPIRYSTLRSAVGVAASIGLIIGLYSIGKMVVSNSHIDESSKINLVASRNQPTTAPAKEQIDVNKLTMANPPSEYHTIEKKPVKASVSEDVSKTEEHRREEFVPTKLASIESKVIVIRKNVQYEQLALFIEAYPRFKDLANVEAKSFSNNNSTNSNVREIGVFEIIQYGVQSFGKLIGKDFRLKANKDKKGRIKKISFESNLFAFSAPIRKKE